MAQYASVDNSYSKFVVNLINVGISNGSKSKPKIFEYKNTENISVHEEMVRLTTKGGDYNKESYDLFGKFDKGISCKVRFSPQNYSEEQEYLWDKDYTQEKYYELATTRMLTALHENEEFRKNIFKAGKLDEIAQKKTSDTTLHYNICLDLAIQYIPYMAKFDSYVATAIRNIIPSYKMFSDLHDKLSLAVETTFNSVVEMLDLNENSIIVLLEINSEFIEKFKKLDTNFSIEYTSNGFTAIIYPSYMDSTITQLNIENSPDAYLNDENTDIYKETLILKWKKLILIGSHLSAKTIEDAAKEVNPNKNMESQRLVLNKFVTKLTEESNICISGVDYNQNTFVGKAGNITGSFAFPETCISTTCKERSALQVQFKKINKFDTGSKDRIVISQPDSAVDNAIVVNGFVGTLPVNKSVIVSHELYKNSTKYLYDSITKDRSQYPIYGVHFPDHDRVLISVLILNSYI
jgi:hypothetical protein